MHACRSTLEDPTLQLVEHFGDKNDPGTPCGLCDVCAPESCVALAHREPSHAELDAAARILEAVGARGGLTVGQVHRELFPSGDFDRRSLEHVLAGLVRAGEVRLEDDSFMKNGASVHFQRVFLAGDTASASGAQRARFTIAGDGPRVGRRSKASPSRRGTGGRKDRKRGRSEASGSSRSRAATAASSGARSRASTSSGARVRPQTAASGALFEALRAWRLAEAKRTGLPAFRVLNDRTLLGVATETPRDEDALLRVAGIGPGLARRYGAALLGIVARHVSR